MVEFVRAHTCLGAPPYVPELRLWLAEDAFTLWEQTERELGRTELPPPFWAFAWAGGQALARHVLDHPHLVAGRRVLDLAAGSGLVAVAAARAGAAAVTAAEVDPLAVAAIGLNARANGVAVTALLADLLADLLAEQLPGPGPEVVLAGDVFYERSMAERVLRFLDRARGAGASVLVGDPGRTYLPRDRLRAVATCQVPVPAALEDAEVKQATVWRLV